MSGFYENFQSRLIRSAAWQAPNARAIEQVYGAEKDTQMDRVRQGLLSNLPGLAQADALPFIGDDRMLPRGVGETVDADYAERLRTTWDRADGWSFAGSHGSILFALKRAGFLMGTPAGAHVMQRIRRYSWLASGVVTFGTHPIWTFDGSPATLWNQFGIIFGSDVTDPTDGVTPLAVDTPGAARLNATVRLWKPAKARFMGTWVIASGPTWGWPVGVTWGQLGRNWDNTGVTRFIPP